MIAIIYVIRETETSYFKIGYTSKEPSKRLGELQTGNPRQLKLVRYIEIEKAYQVEQLLHNVLGKWHVKREWFNIPPQDESAVFTLFDAVIKRRR